MVRNLVGTFLLAGKRGPVAVDIGKILAARDRSAAAATAPPHGLFLVSVEY
jgi:tRNA pseudouridine38-40 synthase